MVSIEKRIEDNLSAVRQRIADAAQRSGRTDQQVQLVGVTKYVDTELTRLMAQAGCNTLGESRPQQLWSKAQALTDLPDIQWHMIGHLQRNKIAKTLPNVSLCHSLDSARLLQAVNNHAEKTQTTVDALIEINISEDTNKTGFSPTEVPNILHSLSDFPFIHITGLMAMASRAGGLDEARRNFCALRELRDHLASQFERCELNHLSMGMSNDFEVAIEEGATIVRVGSALFEGIEG